MNRACSALLVLLSVCVPGRTRAQAPEGKAVCLSAEPKPQCGAFVLTNAGLYSRLLRASPDEGAYAAVLDYGLMVNVGPRDAVGASFFASIETRAAAGPAVHYRRWFDATSSLDAAVGVATIGQGAPGVYGLLKVNPAPWVGVALRPKLVRGYDYTNCAINVPCTPATRTRLGAAFGVEFGGAPGVLAALAGVLAFLIGVASSAGLN
jgi:hypothetical protein